MVVVFSRVDAGLLCGMWWLLFYIVAMVLHELGHVLAAKTGGVRVERVFLGLDLNGFALVRWKVRHTTIGVGWFLLASYTLVAGCDPAVTDHRPDDLLSKSKHIRAWIMAGGSCFNMAVAGVLWLLLGVPLTIDGHLMEFVAVNAAMGLFQLLPLPGHDGHAMIKLFRTR